MSKHKSVTTEQVLNALQELKDPIAGFAFAEYGLIRDVEIDDGKVGLTFVSIIPSHPKQDEIDSEITQTLVGLDGISEVEINVIFEVPKDERIKGVGSSNIKTLIAVASGKGGVGKSTISVNLAVLLAQMGAKVGLMDADVYGPNIPMMMGVHQLPAQSGEGGILPAEAYQVKMISIGFSAFPFKSVL